MLDDKINKKKIKEENKITKPRVKERWRDHSSQLCNHHILGKFSVFSLLNVTKNKK